MLGNDSMGAISSALHRIVLIFLPVFLRTRRPRDTRALSCPRPAFIRHSSLKDLVCSPMPYARPVVRRDNRWKPSPRVQLPSTHLRIVSPCRCSSVHMSTISAASVPYHRFGDLDRGLVCIFVLNRGCILECTAS